MEEGGSGRASSRIDAKTAVMLADTMHALSTPSRVLILDRLRGGDLSVGELSVSVGMEQSAVSHQLRVLRQLGLIIGRRRGKRVVYRLQDEHVAALLEHAFSHAEQLTRPTAIETPAGSKPV